MHHLYHRHTLLSLLAGLLLSSGLAYGQDDPTVRGVQLVSDGPAIDVYIDDVTPAAFQNVNYLDASRILTLAPGVHNAKAALTGTSKEMAVISQDYQFNADSAYVVIASGTLQTLDVAPVFLRRSLARKPGPGSSIVRFFHGAPEAPPVSLAIVDISGNSTVYPATSFRGVTDFKSIPGGAAQVYVIAGSDTVHRASGALVNGGVLTLIAAGDVAEETFGVYVLGEQSSEAARPMDRLTPAVSTETGRLRLVNMLENNDTEVDVVIDGRDPVTLSFSGASDVLELPAGTRDLSVYTVGQSSGGTPLYSGSVDVFGGLYRAAYIAAGGAGGNEVVVLTADATARPGQGQASVRFLNLFDPGTFYSVRLQYPASNRTVNLSGFGSFTPYDKVAPGMVTVSVTPDGQTDPLVTFSGPVRADTAYTLALGPDRGLYRINDFARSATGAVVEFQGVSSVNAASTVTSVASSPNPATTSVRVFVPTGMIGGSQVVEVFNSLGQQVLSRSERQSSGSESIITLDVEALLPGLYYFLLRGDDQTPTGAGSFTIAR